jgi:hypothetical protein
VDRQESGFGLFDPASTNVEMHFRICHCFG